MFLPAFIFILPKEFRKGLCFCLRCFIKNPSERILERIMFPPPFFYCVGLQDNFGTEMRITTKFSEIVGIVNGKNWLDFGGDPPLCLDLTRLKYFNGDNSRTVLWITMKFSGFVGLVIGKHCTKFEDPTLCLGLAKFWNFVDYTITRERRGE